jgi:type II secretion system protein H
LAVSITKTFFRKCLARTQHSAGEAGFTLIEILIALAVFAIVMGVAVLAIPNHDNRYWQDNLDQLVSSLNMAQEESAMAGMPIVAQIDSAGWRFYSPGTNAANAANTASMANIANTTNAGIPITGTSGLMPDVYRPQAWHKPVEISALQITLGGEQITQAMQIPIKQENRQAILLRKNNGLFSWIANTAP